MSFRTIRLEADARGIATVTLDRPEKHHAIDAAMIAELTEAAAALGADPSVRAVVLAATGSSFCAGGDLDWMRAQAAADRAGKIAEAGRLSAMLAALNALPKPLIGRVQGNVYGGGVGLVAVCDLAIAAEGIRLALSEICAPEALDERVDRAAEAVLKAAPGAVAAAKALCLGLGADQAADIARSIAALADRWESDEAQGRIRAFLE